MPAAVPRFSAVVDSEGKVRFDNRAAWDTYCTTFAKQHVEISIQRWRVKRTLAENRAWWLLVIGTLSEWNGDEPETWHKRLKRQFGVKSTARLTIAEFEELRERAIRWAATEHGVVIPDPTDVSL